MTLAPTANTLGSAAPVAGAETLNPASPAHSMSDPTAATAGHFLAPYMARAGYGQDNMASPCVGICTMDDASGYCMGCARTGQEIADWRDADASVHEAVWREVPLRRKAMGLTTLPLPWKPDDIAAFVAESLTTRAGTWVVGIPGALGEFWLGDSADGQASTVVERGDRTVTATTGAHRLTISIHDKTRALAINDPDGQPDAPRGVALTVLKTRVKLVCANVLTEVSSADAGPSFAPGAGAADEPAAPLFDLGLGHTEHRFCVAVSDPDLAATLRVHLGEPFETVLAQIGPDLVAASPTRIIDTGLGRLEINGPIPLPAGTTPCAPHTHLLPDVIAMGAETPDDVRISKYYTLGAQFHIGAPERHA